MTSKLMIAVGAAMLAGTSIAAAQVRDDPPGWAWQHRGILDSDGINPNRPYRYRGAYDYGGAYDSYGAYGYAGRAAPSRSYRYRRFRADDPPGSRYQDEGIRQWDGTSHW
jgi:hypothetical protein